MRINEITRPSNIQNAAIILQKNGYKRLGKGSYATVWARKDEPFCLKLFDSGDYAYTKYLRLIERVRNVHFPQIKGKLIKINDNYYAVRMERLEKLDESNIKLIKYILQYFDLYKELIHLQQQYYDETQYGQKIYKTKNKATYAGTGQKINYIRTKLQNFEEYYPELAEALRLIADYISQGILDIDYNGSDGNIMQREDGTLVITDPVSYTEKANEQRPSVSNNKQLELPVGNKDNISIYRNRFSSEKNPPEGPFFDDPYNFEDWKEKINDRKQNKQIVLPGI